MSSDSTNIWTVDNGFAGFRAQTLGLARALSARLPKSRIAHLKLPPGRLYRWRPDTALARAELCGSSKAPDILIACGRDAMAPALSLKRRHGAFAVCIQRPPSVADFDAVICGLHDGLNGESVLAVAGTVGPVTADELKQRAAAARAGFAGVAEPRTALLVGGGNRAFSLQGRDCRQFGNSLLRASDGGFLVSTSRRTGSAATKALKEVFAGDQHFFYDGTGDNPYSDMLAAADRLVVSCDSVNMLSEACSTGRPVYILPLRRRLFGGRKFENFHRWLVAEGCARYWRGEFSSWQPKTLKETERACDFVLRRWALSVRKKP